jgi:hypothetical protein
LIGLKAKELIHIMLIRNNTIAYETLVETNSPTNQLKADIASEVTATSPTNVVTPLNRITAISGGIDRDSATLSPSDFTIQETPPRLRVRKDIPITSSYVIDKVVLYSGSKPYFETTLSPPLSVNSGDILRVDWLIQLLVGLVSPTGIFVGALAVSDQFVSALNHILAQNRGTRNLIAERIVALQVIPPAVLLDAPTTNDPTNKKIKLPPTPFTASGNLGQVKIYGSRVPYNIEIRLQNLIAVTTENYLKVEFQWL